MNDDLARTILVLKMRIANIGTTIHTLFDLREELSRELFTLQSGSAHRQVADRDPEDLPGAL